MMCGVILAVMVCGASIGVLALRWDVKHRRERILSAIDGRWNGSFQRRFWGERIEVRIEGIPGIIDCRHAEGQWTRVRFHWPSAHRLRLAPEDFASSLHRLFGATEIVLGDREFDDRFWIEASDPAWARRLLDLEVRGDLLHVATRGSMTIHLDLGFEGLSLRMNRILIYEREGLGLLVELAWSLLEKARSLVEESGVALEGVRIRSGSGCPVCGQAVAAGRNCPKCRTPHHQECWSYFGGCAIFACGTPTNALLE